MPRYGKIVASAAVSLSLIATSTAAVASTATPAAPSSNAWLALSALTPSGSALLGTTGVAAAQPDSVPPGSQTCPDGTVIPATATCAPPPGAYTGPTTPPIPVLLIRAAVLGTMVYLATKNHHLHPKPNSPA